MRRSAILFILVVLFGAGGVACLALDLPAIAGPRLGDAAAMQPGALLLAVGVIIAAMAIWWLRRDCGRLARQVRTLSQCGQAAGIDPISSDLMPLTRALNDLVSSTEQSVSDAAMRVKELEIQLKVATNGRHHAEAILHSISDAVLVTDSFDEVVLANEAAARTLGFDLTGATRQPIGEALGDPTLIELVRDMRASHSRARRVVEHTLSGPAGTRVFKVTLACVNDQSSGPAGVVTVLHDMTKEKEVAAMKSDFVSNVSHELRTPLASIKAYVEMLIDGEAEDEKTQHEFYEVIQGEANRLGRLIDNILNISRIESGLVQVNKKPLSLPIVLREAIEVITPQAQMKNIRIVEKVTPTFYQTMADKDMLYQAVLNLLGNAVKYTPEGGTVTVQADVNESLKKVTTRITDTGVGIPAKDLPYIFDKFFRVEQNNQMAKGTGLGLSLVKHIVENVHKGRLLLESTIGKGTTFGFELDLCE